jgi:hypothetical protein
MRVSQLADGPIAGTELAPAVQLSEPEVFAQKGYLPLPGLVPPRLVGFLRQYALLRLEAQQLQNGDTQVANTPAAYGDPAFETLLETLRPRIAQACGRRLHPTYSFFRIYKKGDILRRHTDRKACEVSVTVNIQQSPGAPWPMFLDGADGVHAAVTQPGDGLMYQGCVRPHWREEYTGQRMIQAFLHYVDADGPNADQKFDRRRALMRARRD